jgi:carboxymethylenebutenolidase
MAAGTSAPLTDARLELDSLRPAHSLTRREFVATSLGAGFAAAAGPVQAQTMIVTDSVGLEAGMVSIPAAGGDMAAYRAAPLGKPMLPTILVVQEIFGVHEHIKDICRRFAKLGLLAIAPELYARQGDASKYSDIPTLVNEVVSKVPDEQVMGDLDACVAWAQRNRGDTTRLGITGFCWGGRIVWLYAAHNPKLAAGVAWYGRLVGDSTPLQPKQPIDLAPMIHCPVLGLYGGADSGIPVATIEQMKEALKANHLDGAKSEFVVYPDTPHAFNADYRPSYRKAAAEDGWKRCIEWLRRHRVG